PPRPPTRGGVRRGPDRRPGRQIEKKTHALPPTVKSKRLSPSVTMSGPAASCSAMMLATASRYCSRKRESPSADLNDRPERLRSDQSGRGEEPVIVVGRIMSRGTVSTDVSLVTADFNCDYSF